MLDSSWRSVFVDLIGSIHIVTWRVMRVMRCHKLQESIIFPSIHESGCLLITSAWINLGHFVMVCRVFFLPCLQFLFDVFGWFPAGLYLRTLMSVVQTSLLRVAFFPIASKLFKGCHGKHLQRTHEFFFVTDPASHLCAWADGLVPVSICHGGTPKWLVYSEKPIYRWMITGGNHDKPPPTITSQ